MIVHEEKIRVYYKDTDAGGVMYHTRYAEFMEIVRTEMFREIGLPARDLVDRYGIICPVVELRLEFKKSARYDDVITVRCTLSRKTPVRLYFHYDLFNQRGELLSQGVTVNCGIDVKTLRPRRFPEVLLKSFEKQNL